MKSIINYLMFALLLGLSGLNSLSAQTDKKDGYGGHWFLGLNGGAAWQQSDVKTLLGGGGGFYLGKNIFYSPTAPLSLDLRFRYLGTATYGQDFQTTNIAFDATLNGTGSISDPDYSNFDPVTNENLGFVYHNHKTNFNDLSLEARINFENLRRKHKIWLSLYGGIGVGIYGVRYDQFNGSWVNNNTYSGLYTSVAADPNLTGKDEIVNQILANRDGSYETPMYGSGPSSSSIRGTFTPDAGIELGYWVTPRFALGVGHRVNWTFKDDFDGVIRGGGMGNIHHYANLFLHFRLSDGRTSDNVNNNNNNNNNNNFNNNPVVPCPQVQITTPINENASSEVQNTRIAVSIRNVETNSGLMFYVNNVAITNYSFNPTTDAFEAYIALNPGNNNIRIKASNACGSQEDQVNIVYSPNQIINNNPNPPTVRITNPASDPYNTNSPTANINATITNVASAGNVTFTVNGQTIRNFNFSGTGFSANNIGLLQGNNTVVITATNVGGTASDQININYQPIALNPPTVNITAPNANPYSTQNPSETIRASITNVSSANNVTFTVNGQNVRNFNFSGTAFIASNIALQQGSNSIVISASNNDGNASDQTVIIFENVRIPAQPSVIITLPTTDPFTSASSTANIRATITNVPSRSNVNFFINGIQNSNFSFSGTSFTANNIAMNQGHNTILINASNQDGTASDQTIIIYKPVLVPQPPTVTITNPTIDPFTTQNATQTITATITNVSNSANIQFTVNGIQNNNFSFNGTSFIAQNIGLNQGNNTVLVSASNQDGTVSDQTVIVYQPVRTVTPPTVIITIPSREQSNSSAATSNINATVTNISNASGITFTVNGVPNGNFTLNGVAFSANNIALVQGNNTIIITATNQDGTASDQAAINYQPVRNTTPPTVMITNPQNSPFNSPNATQTINAQINNVSSAANVTFTVNGAAYTNFNLNGPSFAAINVPLVQGNNTVIITATNQDGTASDNAVIVYQPVRIVTPPTVIITIPSREQSNSSAATSNINATVTNISNASGITFTVNGVPNGNFTLNGVAFSAKNIALVQGNNTLIITATNQDGTASDQAAINYQPVRNATPPTVMITNPQNSPFNSPNATQTINAQINNVSSAANVTFTVNGAAYTNFNLNGPSFAAINVPLIQGNNTVIITATNQDGTASDNAVIVYQPVRTVTPPTVVITNPSTNPYNTNSASAVINATITNVNNAQSVTFTVNGQNVRNFSMNGTSFSANNVNLNDGSNSIVISASNQDGNASDNVAIVYAAPVQPPLVTITAPAANPSNSATSSANISATILNVTNPGGVRFMVNGQNLTNFNFSGTSFSASNISLNQGANTFTITGTNSAGTDTKSTVINYNPPKPPTIDQISANVVPQTNGGCSINVSTTLFNVSNVSEITFKVNGVLTSRFTFNNGAFSYTHNVTTNVPNTISYEITVNTAGGRATKTQTANVGNCAVQTQAAPVISNFGGSMIFPRSGAEGSLRATISNITSANQISLKVNGIISTAFTFTNGAFVADNIPLVTGNNTYIITATNSAGTDTKSTVLNDGSDGSGGTQNRSSNPDGGNKDADKTGGKIKPSNNNNSGKLNNTIKPKEGGL